MPFTLFHLGPALVIGLLANDHLDLPALLISTVFIDVEPLLNMLRSSPIWHGFLHSFFGATVFGVFTAIILLPFKERSYEVMRMFKLEQHSSLKKMLFGSLIGVYTHVSLDSFLYWDIKPFYPSPENPFYGRASFSTLYLLCMASFILALVVYNHRAKGNKAKI
ncbi:MAG: DUF4184 family protein [Candidatus Hydrothermarchaeales archaeon]